MILDRFRVTDQVAIVTGAGRGIGAGSALALAEAGAHVVCAARTVEQINEVAEKIRALGRKALAIPCDVNDRAQLENIVTRTIGEFGQIDIVVNNAGGTPPQEALFTSEQMLEEAFHFNVTTAFLLSRLAARHMIERGAGAVVNISSSVSRFPLPGFVAYCTAKAALSHMTRVLAHEWAPKIRLNALAVGSVETSALALFIDDDLRTKMSALTPMRRLGTVEDVAAAVLYLASPAASWVTGKGFEIDGGSEQSNWPFPPPQI